MSIVPESSSVALTDTGPFVVVPEWVLFSDVSPTAVRLYTVLGTYADRKGICWPSRRTLAEQLKTSVKTVDRALSELVDLRAVAVEKRYTPAGDRAPNRYFVYRSMPHMRLRGDTSVATCGDLDDDGGGDTSDAENHTQLQPDPVESDSPQGPETNDALTLRLVRACTGSRVKVWSEAPKVVSLLREHYDDRKIDEAIGVCLSLNNPPILPRYVLKVAHEHIDTGTHVPDLFEAFMGGDAA